MLTPPGASSTTAVQPVTSRSAPSLRSWLRDGAGVLAVKIGGVVAAAAAHLFLARWLGTEACGVYVSVYALLCMAVLLGKFGFEPATQRFVGTYRAAENRAELAGFFGFRARQLWWMNLALLAAGGIALALLSNWLAPMTWWCAWVALAILPLAVLNDIQSADLRAIGAAQRAEWISMLLRPALLILLAGSAMASGSPRKALTAMAALLIAYLVSAALQWVSLRQNTTSVTPVAPTASETKLWREAGLLFTWIAVCQAVMLQSETLLLGVLSGPEPAAIFAAALRLAQMASLGILAVTATNAPAIAGLFAQEKLAELQQAATRMAIAATLFTLPVVFVLALFGRSILGWFGADFSQGYVALVILLAGQTINALCGAGAALLGMTGRHRELALAQTAAAVVKLVLLVVVIPVWGLIGAALVSVGCTAICNALMVWFVARRLSINSAALVPVSLFGSRSACPRTIA